MVLSIIHYLYLGGAVLLLASALILIARYLYLRTIVTLIFTVFVLCFAGMSLAYFSLGLFGTNTAESILTYRIAMMLTFFTPTLLLTFFLYPLLQQYKNKDQTRYRLTLLIMPLSWIVAVATDIVTLIGEVTLRYTFLDFDVYAVSLGPLSYFAIVSGPLSIAVINIAIMIAMVLREHDKSYRMRAVLLTIGWILAVFGVVCFITEATMALTTIAPIGVLLMSIAIRKRSS